MVGPFFNRSFEVRPRFALNALSGNLIRYSGLDYVPWDESIYILHVNLSGVAFAVPHEVSPVVGEWLDLLTPVGGTEELGQFLGKVVHTQELSEGYRGVVVQFLSSSLAEKFELSRAFSDLHVRSMKSESQTKPELPPDLISQFTGIIKKPNYSRAKALLVAIAFFWLLAVTLILIQLS